MKDKRHDAPTNEPEFGAVAQMMGLTLRIILICR